METHSARSCELVVIKDTDDVFFANVAPVVPGQTSIKFDAVPVIYQFQVQAMAGQSFEAVVTVGPPPVVTDTDSRILVYAAFISENSSTCISSLVQRTVRRECQALIAAAGSITMEQVNTRHVKQTILQRVEAWLRQYGLMVYHFDFDAVLSHAYFSNLVSFTDKVKQHILFVKELKAADLNHQLTFPKRVFDHLLESSGATFEPGTGLTYTRDHLGSQDNYRLNFNVIDDWGTIRELTCRVRTKGTYSKSEVVYDEWKRFVYDWNLRLGDFIIFYELFGHFSGVKYKIGVVRMNRSP